jgi:hypothetical protein
MWDIQAIKQRAYYWALILALVVHIAVLEVKLIEHQWIIQWLCNDLIHMHQRVLGI